MTILVDASAIVAILTREPEARDFGLEIRRHADRLCCSSGLWEAARAIARKRTVAVVEAWLAIERLRSDFALRVVAIGHHEARLALQAHERYGKGTGHPARLNMGDCFAYACAQTNGAEFLYKGDDFSKTDMA